MDPITGTHCREAGAFAPPFFLRLIFSETRRDPTPAPRAKRTGQHAPPWGGPPPPDKSPGQIPDTPPDAGPRTADRMQKHNMLGPDPCAAEQHLALPEPRTADAGPAKNGAGPVDIGSFFLAKKFRGAAQFSRPAALWHECLCHVSRK